MGCGCKQGTVTQSVNPQALAQAATPVDVQYIGSCNDNMEQVGEPDNYTGVATLYNYGLVQCGDIMTIWLPDLLADPDSFNEV